FTLKRGNKTVVTVRRELQPPADRETASDLPPTGEPPARVEIAPFRVQIARIGKAATALVEVKAARGQGYGSAFCIHPGGWSLTNAHVAQGEITLVLNPSLKTEKAYPARIVRSDNDLDLALLQADGARDLPALSLGSDEALEEQMDVMAFGFPLVGGPAPG